MDKLNLTWNIEQINKPKEIKENWMDFDHNSHIHDVIDPNTEFKNEKKDKLLFASTPMESFEGLKNLHKFLEEKKPVHDYIDNHTYQLSQLENLHQDFLNQHCIVLDNDSMPKIHEYICHKSETIKMSSNNAKGSSLKDKYTPIVEVSKIIKMTGTKPKKNTGSSLESLTSLSSNSKTESMLHQQEQHFVKDRLELASNLSECSSNKYEVESNGESEGTSNISDVTGYEEEMFRIRRLLLNDSKNSIDCSNSSNKDIFKNEIDRLRFELEATKSERDRIKLELIQNQSKNNVQTQLQIQEILKHKLSLESQLENEQKNNIKLQRTLKEISTQFELKIKECTRWKEELLKIEKSEEKLRINLQEIKLENESRNSSIQGLKMKITEQHLENQMLTQDKIKLNNNLDILQAEIDSLQITNNTLIQNDSKESTLIENQLIRLQQLLQTKENLLNEATRIKSTNEFALSQSENKIQESQEIITNLQQDNDRLNTLHHNIKSQLVSLEIQNQHYQAKISFLHEENHNQTKRIQELEKIEKEYNNNIHSLQMDISKDLQNKHRGLIEQYDILASLVNELSEKNNKLEETMKCQEEQILNQTRSLELQREEIRNKEALLALVGREKQALQQMINNNELRVKELQSQNEQLVLDIDQLSRQLTSSQEITDKFHSLCRGSEDEKHILNDQVKELLITLNKTRDNQNQMREIEKFNFKFIKQLEQILSQNKVEIVSKHEKSNIHDQMAYVDELIQRLNEWQQQMPTEFQRLKERQLRYDSNIRSLLKTLKSHMRGRRSAEQELKETRQQLASNGEIKTLRTRVATLTAQLEIARVKNEQVSESVKKDLDDNLDKQKDNIAQLQKEIWERSHELAFSEQQCKQTKTSLEAAHELLDSRSVELGRSSSMCALFKDANSRLSRQLEAEQQAHETCRCLLEQISTSQNKSSDENDAMILTLQNERDSLKEELASYKKNIEELEEKLGSLYDNQEMTKDTFEGTRESNLEDESILQSLAKNKSLNLLQFCLESLNQEMGLLQNQLVSTIQSNPDIKLN